MWGVAAVADGSPPGDPQAVLRRVSLGLRRDTRTLRLLLARIRPHLAAGPDTDRLLAPVEDYLLICPRLADTWDPDTDDGTGRPLPPLSTSHLTTLRITARRLVLRTAGLLQQLVRGAGRDPAGALPELERLLDAWCADYRDGCAARWIPVARQAEYQARMVLAAFELAGRHASALSRSGEAGWGAPAAVPMHRE